MVVESTDSEVIDPIYLPFKPAELRPHLLIDTEGQLKYYQDSAKPYHEFCRNNEVRKGIPISRARFPCQIEKDERFWTATALKYLFDSPNRTEAFSKILAQEFGSRPPIPGFDHWTDCLDGPLRLILEGALPSPKSYVAWLRVTSGNIRDASLQRQAGSW
jgi:hypothetical protein